MVNPPPKNGNFCNFLPIMARSSSSSSLLFALASLLSSTAAFTPRPMLSPLTMIHHAPSTIQHTPSSTLSAIPSLSLHTPTDNIIALPSYYSSILASSDELIPEYQTANAFQDDVSIADLTSDPFIQGALALSAIIIIALFIAKSIVTQMDDAVQKTALDFDRVMRNKYPKKWDKFIEMEESLVGVVLDREEKEGDRIQCIVEEMERLTKEEPEFFEKVMRDVDRKI
jgi:hypothetical protein